jgi:hypothetical protein
MHLSASAIALRRLMRANALLLEIVSGLYDQQASRWTAPTAPSVALMARRTLVRHRSADAVSYSE